jgi:hypothetical protein
MRHDFHGKPVRAISGSARNATWSWKKSLALLAMLVPAVCIAHQPSKNECIEGSDFIKNAALARDGGIGEDRFIGRVQEDIEAIQSLPPQLRWFVQDDEAAEFLITAVANVFHHPEAAQIHQAEFLQACLRKTTDNDSHTF